jgi:hypothetical protein
MGQAVMCLSVTVDLRVRFQSSPCVKRGSRTCVSASTSVVPCQYHSTNATYSFIHHLSAMHYKHKPISASLNNIIQRTIWKKTLDLNLQKYRFEYLKCVKNTIV